MAETYFFIIQTFFFEIQPTLKILKNKRKLYMTIFLH